MEEIITKAHEGNYLEDYVIYRFSSDQAVFDSKLIPGGFKELKFKEIVCDPLFWQALGKACGWERKEFWDEAGNSYWEDEHIQYAMTFYRINIKHGWDKAISYLRSICGIDRN